MNWKLSRFRAGDFVEVRGKEEILATLDAQGRLENLPFMPEMLQYCGRRFRVAAVAHKSCDMIGTPGTARRMSTTVHLEGLRCDGSAHGGCQAECNLYWKDDWLKPVDATPHGESQRPTAGAGCTESQLNAAILMSPAANSSEVRYACQGTRLFEATEPLPWWNVRQYLFDITSRNRRPGHVIRVLFLAALRRLQPRVPIGYRLFGSFSERMHRALTGRGSPRLNAGIADGAPTPTGTLDLKAGERVRIKPQAQIEQTVNRAGLNRGMTFDHEEMAPYCGRTFTVRKRVTRIIEERTGRMLEMKQPCIMLEGVVCKSEYARNRLNCPRAIPAYWREIWLERVEDGS